MVSRTSQRAARQRAALPPTAQRGRRWDVRYLTAVAGAVLLLVVAAWTLLPSSDSGAQTPAPPDCGWDLTQTAGVQANSDYMTTTYGWLDARAPGSRQMPPPPTSPYWHGECPVAPGGPPPPPVNEAHP